MESWDLSDPLTWTLLRDLLTRSLGRDPAWVQAGLWALETLESQLGLDWPALLVEKHPDHSAGDFAWMAGHVVAYATVLELALRLDVLSQAAGIAKVRR